MIVRVCNKNKQAMATSNNNTGGSERMSLQDETFMTLANKNKNDPLIEGRDRNLRKVYESANGPLLNSNEKNSMKAFGSPNDTD